MVLRLNVELFIFIIDGALIELSFLTNINKISSVIPHKKLFEVGTEVNFCDRCPGERFKGGCSAPRWKYFDYLKCPKSECCII